MSTEIKLDPSEQWKYLSPDAVPPNVPTTGEDSTVIAPWLEAAVSYTFSENAKEFLIELLF